MTDPERQRLREYRRRADLKRRSNLIQARLPPDLARRFRHYLQTTGLNQNQALIAILSTFLN